MAAPMALMESAPVPAAQTSNMISPVIHRGASDVAQGAKALVGDDAYDAEAATEASGATAEDRPGHKTSGALMHPPAQFAGPWKASGAPQALRDNPSRSRIWESSACELLWLRPSWSPLIGHCLCGPQMGRGHSDTLRCQLPAFRLQNAIRNPE